MLGGGLGLLMGQHQGIEDWRQWENGLSFTNNVKGEDVNAGGCSLLTVGSPWHRWYDLLMCTQSLTSSLWSVTPRYC